MGKKYKTFAGIEQSMVKLARSNTYTESKQEP